MTLADLLQQLKDWSNRPDISDSILTQAVRDAESVLSTSLRSKYNVKLFETTTTQVQVDLPDDWKELDYVRLAGEKPLKLRIKEEFFTYGDEDEKNTGWYTIAGNVIYIGGPVSSKDVEINYFHELPHLGDGDNPLSTYQSTLYRKAALVGVWDFAQNTEKKMASLNEAMSILQGLNDEYKIAQISGSRLTYRPKGFG